MRNISNSVTVNTSSYLNGTYTVTLVIDDVPADTKSIIKN